MQPTSTDILTEIVCLAQAGDQEAFARLVELYQQPALRVALNILGNSEEAQDAAQDAWIFVMLKLPALRDAAKFNFWLYRIVKNIALRKRQQKGWNAVDISLLEEVLPTASDDEPAENLEQWLPLAMNALSEKDYLVTSLHFFSRLPLVEIGQLLELPPGTVKSRLFHAKRVLRKEITKMKKQAPEYLPDDFRKVIGGMKGEIRWAKIFAGDLKGWSYQGNSSHPSLI